MDNEKKENEIFEIEALKKWAFFHEDRIKNAKNKIVPYTQYSLFKEDNIFFAYIAKIVIYSLSYETSIETMIEEDPKNWVKRPDYTQSESNYYSIQRDKKDEKIIIATGIKDCNDKPYYLIFSENRKLNAQPWFFDKITTCTNYIKNKPICITDSIKKDNLDKLRTIDTETIDFEHIFSTKKERKGLYRLPVEFQELSCDKRYSLLSEIIKNSFNNLRRSIKSTIRYDKEINRIVLCHYLPLDFSNHGGNKYELYACIREKKGPKFEIPTILTYDLVYSQLLEKPEIDHWTYAKCNFREKEIRIKMEELKKKIQEFEKEKSVEEKFSNDKH